MATTVIRGKKRLFQVIAQKMPICPQRKIPSDFRANFPRSAQSRLLIFRQLRFGVGVAPGQLLLAWQQPLDFIVRDAHRQPKFLQMDLSEDPIVFAAHEYADRRVVARHVQDMLRHRQIAAELTEIRRFVFRGLFFRPGEAMSLEPPQQRPHLGK